MVDQAVYRVDMSCLVRLCALQGNGGLTSLRVKETRVYQLDKYLLNSFHKYII